MKRQVTWGLPLADPRAAWLLCLAVLAAYALSMQRGLGSFDSAELALVAQTLGLGHPPGQPLHTLLGFLFAHLPLVPALFGLNLLSALCGALGVLPMLSLAEWLLARDGAPSESARRFAYGAVALGALHGALWEPATRIEVYPLATLLALWALAWTVTRGGSGSGSGSAWVLGVAGLLLGLSASANPMIATLAALAMAPGLLRWLRGGRIGARAIGAALAGGLLGLLPYMYVLIVAHRSDVLVWGRPVDGATLHHYFSFADFAQNNRLSPAQLGAHFVEWVAWSVPQGILPIFAAGIAAFAWLGRGRGLGATLALGSVIWTGLFIASNVVWKLDNPDFRGYLGVPAMLGVAGLGALVGRLVERPGRAPLALGAVLVLTLVSPPPLWSRTRHQDRFTDELAAATLAELPASALYVSETDHLAAALLYLQLAEGQRLDVVHLPFGLASSSWYWELMQHLHPALERVPLRGPGGKLGRVKRWLAANSGRPVLFERSELAATLAVGPLCPAGWSIASGAACTAVQANIGARELTAPASKLARALAELGDGSPGTAGLIAMVAEEQGLSRWRTGHGAATLELLRAGVPEDLLPPRTALDPRALDAAPAPPLGWPRWQRPALLGDPARNLFLAAALLHAAGDAPAAEAHRRAAAELGLPEALGTTGTR